MTKKLIKKERKTQKCQMGNILSTYTGQIGNITDFNSLVANNLEALWLFNQPQGLATPEQMKNKYSNSFSSTSVKNPYDNSNISSLTKAILTNNTGNAGKIISDIGGNFLNKANTTLSKGIGGSGLSIGGAVTGALSVADQFIPQAEDKASKITSGVFNGLSQVAGMIPGVGTIASVALKGLGTLFGAGVKNVEGNAKMDTVDSSASYTGADALDSKRFGILGLGKAKKYQKQVDKRQQERETAYGILNKGKDDLLASTNVQQMAVADNLSKNASDWMYRLRAGKQGMKFEEGKRLAKLYKKKERPGLAGNQLKSGTDSVNAFKEGGIIKNQNGGQANIIPAGELHARKHDLVEKNPNLKGVTRKGIPVVAMDGGEISQSAEIEREEIIFSLETTKKLEELRKKYKATESQAEKDEIAIEAGALLESEINENTIDNTGLLKEVK